MKYAVILSLSALAVALPQYGNSGLYEGPQRGGRNDGGFGDRRGSDYGRPNSFGPGGLGNGIAGAIAGEVSYDIGKGIGKGIGNGIGNGIANGIEYGIENGIECAFSDRYRCRNAAGQEVPVPENLKAKADLAPRQFFGNLFGGNRPAAEAEEEETTETEIETTGEPISVSEFAPAQENAPAQGVAPVPENLKAKVDLAPRQFFGNLFGGNRPAVEAEEEETTETEIETTGEPIPVLELAPAQGPAPQPEE